MAELPRNQLAIDRAPLIGGKRTRYTIEGVKGLQLDITPGGARSWYAYYQIGRGKDRVERRFRIGNASVIKLKEATDKALEVVSAAQLHGKDAQAERMAPKGATVDDVFCKWVERHGKLRKKTWEQDQARYERHVKARIGSTPASKLTKRQIVEALDEIQDEAGPQSANRIKPLISAFLNWAEAESLIELSPARGIRQRAPTVKRDAVMTADELRAFWNALANDAADRGLKLLLLLGQRREEVAGAHVCELSADIWKLPGGLTGRTKNKLPHDVPLTPLARSLFCDGIGVHASTLSHRFCDVTRSLGMVEAKDAPDDPDVSRYRLHDLRHTMLTNMARMGISREIRERVVNQVTGQRESMGAHYDHHTYLEERRAALAAWEAELLRIVGSAQ